MKEKISRSSRIALAAVLILVAACAAAALILSLLTAGDSNPILSGNRASLKGAENGVTMLLRGATDTDEYFAANYFPTLNGAVGDGVANDTKAIKEALSQAGKTGGTVYLPQGVYAISEPLTVPAGVTLRGDSTSPDAKDNVRTVLFATDAGSLRNAPLITLEDGASLVGITVYYEKQDPSDVVSYPVTLDCKGETRIYRVALINPYQGISLSGSGRADLRSVWMSPLDYGLFVREKTGLVYAEDISVSPTYWLNTVPELFGEAGAYQALTGYLHEHLHCLVLETAGDVTLSRISAEDAAVGILYNVPNDRDALLLASELSLSSANRPLQIQSLPKSGVCFTDSVFRPESGAGANTVELGAEVSSPVVFSACSFSGSPKTVIRGENPGFVSFYYCDFGTWWNACFEMTSSTFTALSPIFRTASDRAVLGENAFGLLYDSPALEASEELLFSVPEDTAAETASDKVSSVKDTNRSSQTPQKVFDARKYGVSVDSQDNSAALSAAFAAAEETGGIVFVPEGTYRFTSPVIVPDSVRLMGVGSKGAYRTEFTFEKNFSQKGCVVLSDGASLENLLISGDLPDGIWGVWAQGKSVRITGVSFTTQRGALLTGAQAPSLEHVTLSSARGIRLEGVTDAVLRDILCYGPAEAGLETVDSSLLLSGFASDGVKTPLILSGATQLRGTLVRFRNGETGVLAEAGASALITALSASAKEGNCTFLKSTGGALTVQGAVVTGPVAEGNVLFLSGGTGILRGALITTSQAVSVYTENGGEASVFGSIWEVQPQYHARALGGSVLLEGNLVLSEKEFTGIDTNSAYLTVSAEGGKITDGVNVKRFTYVESEGGGEESGAWE